MSGSDWFGFWSGLGQVRVRSLSGWVGIGVGLELSLGPVTGRLWPGHSYGWVRVGSGSDQCEVGSGGDRSRVGWGHTGVKLGSG